MNDMNTLNAAAAVKAAVDYADLRADEVSVETVRLDGGYYEVIFTTDWQEYDCFVDAQTGEVPGFSFQPLPELALETRVAA